MFNILERLTKTREGKARTTSERYRDLLGELATAGELDDKQIQALDKAAAELGFTPEKVATDAKAMARRVQLQQIVANGQGAADAVNVAKDRLRQHEAATAKMLADRAAEVLPLKAAIDAAQSHAGAVRRAASDLATLEKQMGSRLLGDEAPADASNRRHVDHAWATSTARGTYPIIQAEAAIGSHVKMQDPDLFTYTPLPGQTEAEMNEALSVARVAFSGELDDRLFLVRQADKYRLLAAEHMGRRVHFEDAAAAAERGRDWSGQRWMVYPGQTRDELDRLVAELAAVKAGRDDMAKRS